VFFGTPGWAVPSLDALLGAGIEVRAVVTNPDRPAGRGMDVQAPPVKRRAEASGVEVLQPVRARDPWLAGRLTELAPDVVVVVAYGKILPAALLAIPRHGFVNVHFSLLPRYRGAAPVQRALMDGVRTTGVSIFVLTEGMDEGPLLATRAVEVAPDETAGDLGARLADLGARLLPGTLDDYVAGRLEPVPQDHAAATYAPKLTADDARVDWSQGAARVGDLVRALNPAPGAWTTFRGARLKLLAVALRNRELAPGELEVSDAEAFAGTGDGAVALVSLQPAGKRAMGGAEWARGARPGPGERFE
jgi:methionyl-tRNA formyltransferase